MNKRPLAITIVSWIFIAVGCISLVVNLRPINEVPAQLLSELKGQHHIELWFVVISAVSALVGGVFMLYGCNWARWLLVVWFAFHVIISLLHSRIEVLIHTLLFGVLLFLVFRRPASAYFSRHHDLSGTSRSNE
jgi:hypothetical protein